MTFARRLTILLSFFWALLPAFAQAQADTDSLVRMMSAQSVHIVEREGEKVREVFGPARFLHNNTYLVCDTAIWHVDAALINAYGHVQILQDETVLSSDELDYFVDDTIRNSHSVLDAMIKECVFERTGWELKFSAEWSSPGA